MKKFAVMVLLVLCMSTAGAYAETISLNIEGATGNLSAVIQKPNLKADDKCPMVMLMHGFTGNKASRPMPDIADLLEKKGIASIRFDFNGHGDSEGNFTDIAI